MVTFVFNTYGYSFQQGLRVFRESFQVAVGSLAQELETAKSEARAYKESLSRGGPWIGQRDDDHVIWEQSAVLEMRADAAREAMMALRKAFAIAIYHHWERSAETWTRKRAKNHAARTAHVLAIGYPVDPRLGRVSDLANALKHNSTKYGPALLESWSELFPLDFLQARPRPDWYGAVEMMDDHVIEVLDIVAASGPTTDTLGRED